MAIFEWDFLTCVFRRPFLLWKKNNKQTILKLIILYELTELPFWCCKSVLSLADLGWWYTKFLYAINPCQQNEVWQHSWQFIILLSDNKINASSHHKEVINQLILIKLRTEIYMPLWLYSRLFCIWLTQLHRW